MLLPFIKEGFERGEKAFHIVDPELRDEHLQRLESAGIDVAAGEQSGQFELRNWADAYLREGHFDQDRMLALDSRSSGGRQPARISVDSSGGAYGMGPGRPPGCR